MNNNNEEVEQYNGDELSLIYGVAESFLNKGVVGNPPKFVMVVGVVGSGKTTFRRQKFSEGYVNFESGEITAAVEKIFGENNPRLSQYENMIMQIILAASIREKKNIVIEIIGDSADIITPIINKMKEIGYYVSGNKINCNPEVAYQRHLKAVENDKDYLSAYFTQEMTLAAFYDELGLGAMPLVDEK